MHSSQNFSKPYNFFAQTTSGLLIAYLKTQTRKLLTLHPQEGLVLPRAQAGKEYTLYVHVPFCESLCPYCSFNRFLFQKEKAAQYFKALRQEIRTTAEMGFTCKTLYIGGGTPTILIDELVQTIDLAKELFDIREVSCETNPNHLTPEYVEKLKGRVQRLSVGVQSFDDKLLAEMCRMEKFGGGELILDRINYAAPYFTSLNVDMIFNFPHQTLESLKRDIEMILNSKAQQVTFYPLMTSSSVKHSMAHSVGKLDHKREWQFYNLINDELQKQFTPLSAWTFVRNSAGMIDEYIVNSDEYVGVGSGSFSYLDGSLYVNTFSIREYIENINLKKPVLNASTRYQLHPQMRYWFMMNLFGMDFDREKFKEKFGISIHTGLWMEMLFMNMMGAFDKHNPAKLTRLGQYFSVVMMREFFSGVNNVRDIARKSLTVDELSELNHQ